MEAPPPCYIMKISDNSCNINAYAGINLLNNVGIFVVCLFCMYIHVYSKHSSLQIKIHSAS